MTLPELLKQDFSPEFQFQASRSGGARISMECRNNCVESSPRNPCTSELTAMMRRSASKAIMPHAKPPSRRSERLNACFMFLLTYTRDETTSLIISRAAPAQGYPVRLVTKSLARTWPLIKPECSDRPINLEGSNREKLASRIENVEAFAMISII